MATNTCEKCGGVHYGTGLGCVYDKKWPSPDKPPDRAEWERLLNRWIDWAVLSVNDAKELRAAVRRALDEREAEIRREDAVLIDSTIGFAQGEKWRRLVSDLREIAAAAEARAKERAGE